MKQLARNPAAVSMRLFSEQSTMTEKQISWPKIKLRASVHCLPRLLPLVGQITTLSADPFMVEGGPSKTYIFSSCCRLLAVPWRR
jgi:hypothetical protein